MNLPVPPRWVRRLVTIPLLWALGVWLLVVGIPVIVILVGVLSFALPGKLRILRLLGFALVYLAVEVAGVAVAFLLWIASGFGRSMRSPQFVDLHYRLLRGCLATLFWFGSRYFQLTIAADGPALPGDDGDPRTTEHPLLVLSRHAGPGDSFLVLHELLSWAGRRPRIVLKSALQLDPLIDVVLNRLPVSFIDTDADSQDANLAAIAELSATMQPPDAILIFPEGANVTPRRRVRAIRRLREAGRARAAARAQRIVHLLPPKPGGVHAALVANPAVDVVVIAHTGLDHLDSLADIWRELPLSKTLHMRWRAIPGEEVPHDLAGLSDWLFTQWEQMDQWIGQLSDRGDDEPSGRAGDRPSGRAGDQPSDPAAEQPADRKGGQVSGRADHGDTPTR